MIRVYVVAPAPTSKNYRLRWRQGSKWQQKSSGKSNAKDAERAAHALETELNAGRYVSKAQRITWSAFADRYETEHLSGLSPRSLDAWVSCRNHVRRLMGWTYLDEATSEAVASFTGLLRKSPSRIRLAKPSAAKRPTKKKTKGAPAKLMAETTVATHLTQLRTALNWAYDVGLFPARVKVKIPRRGKKDKQMRGRPVTAKEFRLMLRATRVVQHNDHRDWRQLLRGLYLSGMRLGEAMIFSWDDSSPFAVDLSGKHPRFRIWSEGEKGRKDRYLPMTPDFATWLLRIPESDRRGLVFKVKIAARDRMESASKTITDIGAASGVVVNSADGKFASAHDLRRSFGTRWAPLVRPVVLQQLMRHKELATTMRFYVAQDVDDVAAELWNHRPGIDRGST